MAKTPFRVVLSGDFRKTDGSPTFPDFDISPLLNQPGLDCQYLERGDEIRAAQVADADALILLTPRFTKDSIHPNGRLAAWRGSASAMTVSTCLPAPPRASLWSSRPMACAGRSPSPSSPIFWRSAAS